jgi:hypothetical protein
VTAPGIYRGGSYGRPEWQPTTASGPGEPRRAGTVYGGLVGRPTSANVDAPIELSGSLTGLILSRGRSTHIQARERRSRLTKVLAIGTGGIVFVVAIGLIVATLAGDFIRQLLGALVK